MIKTAIMAFFFTVAHTVCAEDRIMTREEIFAPITNPSHNPARRYAEIDINGDRINDLVVSGSLSEGGTGGLLYRIYLGLGNDHFKQIDLILANVMALENHGDTTRLWSYSHMSSTSGTIQYRYFDRKGIFQKSEVLTIHPGDGGSDIGNAIYQAVFSTKIDLKLTE